jgi:hypothetical protein
MIAHSNTYGFQPEGIGVNFAMASPGWRAHYASYAAPPYLQGCYNPFPFTGEQPFDSSLLHSPPNNPTYIQESQLHQVHFNNLTSRKTFDSVGVSTRPQSLRLYDDARGIPSISNPSMPPLEPRHNPPTTWLRSIPGQPTNPIGFGLPITTNQHDESPPQTLPFSPETSGYGSQASHTESSGKIDLTYSCEYSQISICTDGASPSSPTAASNIRAPIRITRRHDTSKHGGLNIFLSQSASRSQVHTRSKPCRVKVLKLEDVPLNLRPYYRNHHPIPLPEYDTMFTTTRDGEFCIKCPYDVTRRRRRKGLKYEHANAHLNNRPFQCLDW